MGPIRLLLGFVALSMLSGSPGNGGASSHPVKGTATAVTAGPNAALPAGKLIALTFDDGPRPYVLFGSKGLHPAPALADVLDKNGVKATFFVVGWRLTPKTWGARREEEDIGVTCIDAAKQLAGRGHELEDHTFSHIELRSAERKRGE